MKANQPVWKQVGTIGDVNFLDYRVQLIVGTITYNVVVRAHSAELAIDRAINQLEYSGIKYSRIESAVATEMKK